MCVWNSKYTTLIAGYPNLSIELAKISIFSMFVIAYALSAIR